MTAEASVMNKTAIVLAADNAVTIGDGKRGGPVDVVVITKTNGFIWIKNKSVLDQKLNQHF